MHTKSLRIVWVLVFLSILSCVPLFALTQHEIDMFNTLETKWKERNQALLQERNTLNVDDPRYLELTKAIVEANYKEQYYREAKIDRSSMWVVLTNTFVWSVSDLAETASIMWEQGEGILEKVYSANWSDLMKDAVDSLMRQKIRALIRDTFAAEYRTIEDHIMSNFISPKIDSSKTQQYAQEAFGKVKDNLKDIYVEEVKRQAVGKSAEELKAYGEKIASRVGGAVSAAEFTIDMVQKYVMWDDAQVTIQNLLSAIQNIKNREQCSVIKAFNIYLGKEEMTRPAVEKTTTAKVPSPVIQNAPLPVSSEEEREEQESEPLWKTPTEERFASRSVEQIFAEYGVNTLWRVEKTFMGEFHYDEKGALRFQIKRWPASSEYAGQVMHIRGMNDSNYFIFTYDIADKTYPSPAGMMMKEVTRDIQRSWYPNGQIQEYKRYVQSYCVEHLRWDQDGNLIE